ncbi:hypothetical protein WJR50_21535 [Catalinimonas sp. 4WD22]|uniref:hypothetical protein n=1 Tax=Catalinimonas locisalis TaxID=3133978 RepID=UPI0031016E10
MIRVFKLVEQFHIFVEGLFPEDCINIDNAAKLIGHHLLIINKSERDLYIRNFFIKQSEKFGIREPGKEESSHIAKFIQKVLHNLPNEANTINPRIVKYLYEFSDNDAQRILDHVKFNNFLSSHVLLTEILESGKLKVKTIDSLIELLGERRIEIIVVRYKNSPRRFISKGDYKRLVV